MLGTSKSLGRRVSEAEVAAGRVKRDSAQLDLQCAVAAIRDSMFRDVDARKRIDVAIKRTETILAPDGVEMFSVCLGHDGRQLIQHIVLSDDVSFGVGGRFLRAYWVRQVQQSKVQKLVIEPLWDLLEKRAEVRSLQPNLPFEDIVLGEQIH